MRKPQTVKFFLVVSIIISVVFSSCNSRDSNLDGSKYDELAGTLKSLPLYPNTVEIKTENYSSGSKTSITRKYKSDASFDEVRKFYFDNLIERGWQFAEEQEFKDRGRIKDEHVVYFSRGEFLLSIQSAGERREDLGWDYAVRVAYPADWKRKVF